MEKKSIYVLMAMALQTGLPCAGRTIVLNSEDPCGTVLEKGDTLLIPRGASLDGCLVIDSDSVTVTSNATGAGDFPIWTCTVPLTLNSPNEGERTFGNCIIVRGRGVTIEHIEFRNTLCDIPENHPYIGSFETMWKLGADRQEVSRNHIEGFRAESSLIPWKTAGPSGADGGAIEIDDARMPKSDIHIHHNFSTDNQGFLEVTFNDIAKAPSYSGFRIHDNFSDDYQSFVLLWSGTECLFENNIIIRRKVNGNEQAVFRFTDPLSHNTVRDNTILSAPGVLLFKNRKGVKVTFENNRLYHERNTSCP